MGGDGDVVPAAARRPRRRAGADAVADAGAVRPARGAGGGGALPRLPADGAGGDARARRRRLPRRRPRGPGDGDRALGAATTSRAAERFEALGGDLLGALGRHAAWTSSATHAVLPLLATDAGVRLQLATGIEAHRARFGDWRGGLWSPECAHAPWLDPLLEAAGVRATCVELPAPVGRARPPAPAALARRAGPRPDRPRGDRARVERRRLPLEGAVPGLPRADDPPPQGVALRRRRLRRGRGARAGAARRRALRRPRRGAARARRAVRLRARHRAARALVVRGRRVAAARSSRSAARAASRSCTSTTRSRRSSVAEARRPRRDDVGPRPRPVDVERAEGRRPRVARPVGGAARARRPPRPRRGRRARAARAAVERLGVRRQRGPRRALRARAGGAARLGARGAPTGSLRAEQRGHAASRPARRPPRCSRPEA